MISTLDCVNRIEVLLDSGGQVSRGQLAELVWAYAKACQRLNAKAQECLDLLRQGRRVEAGNLAKEPPDLRQELRLLDFSKREEWLDLCEGAGTPISSSLDPNALDMIVQEVYAESGRLDQLLRSFRHMSLGHAPLADRLRALRRIKKADPAHDFWDEDIRAYEAARLAELVKEAETADVAGDLQTIEKVLGELKSGEWLVTPTRHINAVDKIAVPHRRRYAFNRFGEIAQDLHEAHSGMYRARCRDLIGQWHDVIRKTDVEPDEAMKEGIAPVEAWLADLDAACREDAAFDEACTSLEDAIDEDKDRHTLEQLAAAVFRFERGMPELLAAQFNTRMEEIGRRAKRRFALTLTAIIGGLALIATAVTFVAISQIRRAECEKWQNQIASALEKDDLEGTGKLLRSLADKNPRVAALPEIRALERAYQNKVQQEEERVGELEDLRQRVEEKGTADPDKAALARAGELAKTLEERQWVQDWELKYETAADELRRQREVAFRGKLDALKKLYGDFLQAEAAGQDDLDTLAAPLLASAKELLSATDVSQGLVAEAKAIEKSALESMKRFEEKAGQREAIREVLERLPSLVGNPEELEKTLALFVEKYGEHRLASDFAKAGRMGPHWRAVQAWQLLADGWGGRIRLHDPTEMAARRQQLDDYLKEHLSGPYSAAADGYRSYLETASAAFPGGRLVGLAKVKEVLSHVVFTPALQMIRTKDFRTFYMLKKDVHEQRANKRVVGYSFRYLLSMAMNYGSESLSMDQIEEGPVAAPQTIFAQAVMDRLSKFQGPGWETLYLDLAAQAQAHDGMDPVLTGQVLQLLLGFASNSTPYRKGKVDQYVNQISAENLDFVAWLNPNSDSADSARSRMAQILKSIGPLQSFIASVQNNLDQMIESTRPCYPVGILFEGSERIQFAEPPPDGTLHVLWGAPGALPEFQQIGTVKGSKAEVVRGMTAPYPQGTPVYVRKGQSRQP